jgi:hypothetical protein
MEGEKKITASFMAAELCRFIYLLGYKATVLRAVA